MKNLVEICAQKREDKTHLIYPVREKNRMTCEFAHMATDCLSSKEPTTVAQLGDFKVSVSYTGILFLKARRRVENKRRGII